MEIRKSLPLLCAPLIAGCVSLDSLNDQSLAAGGAFSVVAEGDPCPEAADEVARRMVAPHAAGLIAPTPLAAPVDGSNFERGKAVIAAAAAQQTLVPAATSSLGLDIGKFAEDLPRLTRESITPARAAMASTPANTLVELAGSGTRGDRPVLALDRRQAHTMFRDISEATQSDGWTAAFADSLGAFVALDGASALAGGAALSEQQTAALIQMWKGYVFASYFKAYFRNGRIVKASVLDDALKDRLEKAVSDRISDAALRDKLSGEIGAIVTETRDRICKGAAGEPCFAFGAIGDSKFITRSGQSHGFPGITGTLTPYGDDVFNLETPEWNPVIGDLVRVFVEAAGDATFAVPGVQTSTACKTLALLCGAETDAEDIAAVNELADKIEAGSKSATGVAIRGGWLFSLNNEALASGIETLVSVSARKVAERAAWSRKKACPTIAASPLRTVSVQLR